MKPTPRICLAVLVLAAACGSRVVDVADGGSSSSSAGETTDATSPTSTASTSPTGTTVEPMTGEVSTVADTSTSESTGVDDTSTGADTSTGEPVGTCAGLSQYGAVASVLAREGTSLEDPPCDAMPAPCGGDLVGTWNATVTCGFEAIHNAYAELCPGSQLEVTALVQAGTLGFADDGTFAQNLETTASYTLVLDALGCFGLTCAELEDVFAADAEAMCSGPDDLCSCAITALDAEPVAGTYEILDDAVLLSVGGQAAFATPYCVAGDRLDLWSALVDTTITETACVEPIDCEIALGDRFEAYVCVDDAG